MGETSEVQQKILKTIHYKKRVEQYVHRVKFEKYYHSKKVIGSRYLLSLAYKEMKLRYKHRDLSEVLRGTLKKQGIKSNEKQKIISFANNLVKTFFLELEKQMIERDIAFVWPKRLQYMFLCQYHSNIKDNKKRKHFNVKLRTRGVRLHTQFICQPCYRIPYGHFYGGMNKAMKKKIREMQIAGRVFLKHDDYVLHIKGELKYGQQLKIYNSRSDRFRTITHSQK